MSRMGQLYIAQEYGPQCTLYAAMEKMGLPLTEEQKVLQRYFEEKYTRKEVKPNEKSGSLKDS